MIRLWLDDVRPMPDGFDVHAKTAQEAIALIDSDTVAEISFDHDLGAPENGSGYDVAKHVECRAYYRTGAPPRYAVHSANPVGRRNIIAAMQMAETYFQGWDDEPIQAEGNRT